MKSGISQGVYPFFFGLVGVPASHALAVSLIMNLIAILASTPGGLLWFQVRRANLAPDSALAQPGEQSTMALPASDGNRGASS